MERSEVIIAFFFLVPLHLKLNHFRANRLEVTKQTFFVCAVPESGACPSGFRHSSNSFDCILGRTWGKICKERIESLIIIELSIIKRVIQKQKNSIIGRSLKAIERHQICFTTLYKHMQIETSKIDIIIIAQWDGSGLRFRDTHPPFVYVYKTPSPHLMPFCYRPFISSSLQP